MTYHKISNNHSCHKERDACKIIDPQTIPHGFNPFTAQNTKYHHEWMPKICKVPPGNQQSSFSLISGIAVRIESFAVIKVVLAKQLCSYNWKYEYYNGQNKGQIPKCSKGFENDCNQHVQCWPGFCQFEYAELEIQHTKFQVYVQF